MIARLVTGQMSAQRRGLRFRCGVADFGLAVFAGWGVV
jgi:hypothetical protein